MSRPAGQKNVYYYVTDNGYRLELETATKLKSNEKIIVEVLRDDPLTANGLKVQLEQKNVTIDYETIRNHLDFLIKEELVDLR